MGSVNFGLLMMNFLGFYGFQIKRKCASSEIRRRRVKEDEEKNNKRRRRAMYCNFLNSSSILCFNLWVFIFLNLCPIEKKSMKNRWKFIY